MRTPALGIALAILLSFPLKARSQDTASGLDQVHANLDWVDPSFPELGRIQNVEDWHRRRDSIRKNIEVVMGSLPDRSRLGPVDFTILEETPLA
ncbi:MAG: hypothetical protein ACK5LQ_16875, partial [Planctomycetota bacterium]